MDLDGERKGQPHSRLGRMVREILRGTYRVRYFRCQESFKKGMVSESNASEKSRKIGQHLEIRRSLVVEKFKVLKCA